MPPHALVVSPGVLRMPAKWRLVIAMHSALAAVLSIQQSQCSAALAQKVDALKANGSCLSMSFELDQCILRNSDVAPFALT